MGLVDICESTLMSAYAEAIHDPVYSMQLASKGIHLIRSAITDLSAMPEKAEQYHQLLAKYLVKAKDKIKLIEDTFEGGATPKSSTPQVIDGILKEGERIYNHNNTHGGSSWLYVGLPEIIAKIKTEGVKGEAKIAEIVQSVYNKWLVWGKDNKHLLIMPSQVENKEGKLSG